ncbi:MAG: energy transducer TonB [Rhodanobacteraceae bacterium]
MKAMLAISMLMFVPAAAMASGGPPSTAMITVSAVPNPPPRELPAVATNDENPRYRTRWSVSLDASGRVTNLEPTDKTLIEAVRLPLDNAIRNWQFIPGKIGGEPAATDTTLALDISLVPVGEDRYSVRIDDARTGGDVSVKGIRATPKYPASAIQHRRQGMVVLDVNYDASGRVLATKQHEGAPPVDAALAKSAEQAVKRWSFSPEVVGGHPIAGAAIVPVCFEIVPSGSRPPSTACDWAPSRSHSDLHGGEVFAIEPAARLQSDVIGKTL